MKKADQISGIVLLLFSLLVIAESAQMPLAVEFAPGYGFFPFWLGILMAILSVLLVVNGRRRPADDQDAKPVFPHWEALRSIIAILAGLGVYVLLLEVLGYVVDTLLFVAFLMNVGGRSTRRTTILVAVVTTVALYMIFQVWLGINIPKNIFGF